MKRFCAAAILILAASCSKEQAKQAKQTVTTKVTNAIDAVTTPNYAPETETAPREQQRFDQRWRMLQSFRAAALQRQQQQAAANAVQNIHFVTGVKQSFKGLDANAINNAAVVVPIHGDMTGPSVLRAQVWLDRAHYSVGVIDGRWGRNSAISVWWWQKGHGLDANGDLDEQTFRSIAAAASAVPPLATHQLTADDLKGPFVKIPEDVYEQEHLTCLCYESVREKLAEMFHSSEDFLGQLNPSVDFDALQAGQSIVVPNVRPAMSTDQHDIAKIVISIVGNSFNAFDASGNLVFHAPTTVGSQFDPSPDETVKIVKVIPDPHFHYDPTLYHEVPDWKPDAHLQPGPNSPVGVVWMALSKPHYGIHGTKDPDSIGYVSSHGCIRLTNWDAAEVEHRVSEGVTVSFVDTSHHEDNRT